MTNHGMSRRQEVEAFSKTHTHGKHFVIVHVYKVGGRRYELVLQCEGQVAIVDLHSLQNVDDIIDAAIAGVLYAVERQD